MEAGLDAGKTEYKYALDLEHGRVTQRAPQRKDPSVQLFLGDRSTDFAKPS
jgi:hypothetical protein